MQKFRLLAVLLFALTLGTQTLAQTPAPPAQPMDPDFAAQVKEWTTKPEFLSPLVDHLPTSTTVPSPKSVLGITRHWLRRRHG